MNLKWLISLFSPKEVIKYVDRIVEKEIYIDKPKNLAEWSMKFYGISEHKDNIVLKWIKSFFPKTKDATKVAWCSIGLSAVCKLGGFENPNSAVANDWKKVGVKIPLNKAIIGDVFIFDRGKKDSWQKHVTVLFNKVGDRYFFIGANQDDKFTISEYKLGRLEKIVRLRKVDKLTTIPNNIINHLNL